MRHLLRMGRNATCLSTQLWPETDVDAELDQPIARARLNIQVIPFDPDIHSDRIRFGEVTDVLGKVNTRKACGPDYITNEIIRSFPHCISFSRICSTSASSMAINLSFSTDVNPNRCKRKCLAFLKPDRVLRNIKLNGRDLPWVTSTKHLGSMLHNKENGMVRDLMEKRAAYINKNNELMQEFGFAHSDTMIKIHGTFHNF